VEFIVGNPNSTFLFDECPSSSKILMVFAKDGMGYHFIYSSFSFFSNTCPFFNTLFCIAIYLPSVTRKY